MGITIENDGSENEPLHDYTPIPVSNAPTRLMGDKPDKVTRGVVVKALKANTAAIYLGGSRVLPGTTRTVNGRPGIPIEPGESFTIPCRDPSKLYLIHGAGAEQGAHWIAI